MQTITISPRNGEVSEKKGSGTPGDEFSGVMEGLLAAGVAAWRENVLGCTQGGVYFQSAEGQNVNSGLNGHYVTRRGCRWGIAHEKSPGSGLHCVAYVYPLAAKLRPHGCGGHIVT